MADLHRSRAGAGLPLLIGLAGCGAPISNRVFQEEALFVGALPGAARLAPPREVWLAPAGDAEVLAAAKQAASDWDRLALLIAASGDALREATPAERTEAVRGWEPVNVARRVEGGPFAFPAGTLDWWVRGEVERLGDDEVAWRIELAADRRGPFTEVASGDHDTSRGAFDWDLEATAAALGLEPPASPGTLAVDYDDGAEAEEDRTFGGVWSIDLVAVRAWSGTGEQALGFSAPLALTDDGLSHPAAVTALHGEEGGRAQGELQLDGATALSFSSCWDGEGRTTWLGGDPGVRTTGAARDCAIPPF